MAAGDKFPSSHFLLEQKGLGMADKMIGDVDAREVLTSAVWPTDSTVRLLSVPWDSDYRDVVAWESAESRDAWFAKQSGSWYQSNFQNIRPGEPISVPVPYSSVYQYNYIVVTNPKQPVEFEGPERSYFYFITSAEYLSAQATRLTVQLDVMTTYAGSIVYGRAFVESGHIAMANANARGGLDGGKLFDYLSLPEGIDCGSELVPCKREFIGLNKNLSDMLVIIVSTANLEQDPGTTQNPKLRTADGQTVDGLISGCNVYCMAPTVFVGAMAQMQEYSWVAQCIIAIYTFPGALITDKGTAVRLFGHISQVYRVGTNFSKPLGEEGGFDVSGDVFSSISEGLGADSDVSKLYAYPYSVIELSSYTGNPVYLKPQLLRGNKVALSAICCALTPFAKIGVFPTNYGSQTTGSEVTFDYMTPGVRPGTGTITAGDFIDTAVWLTDFPQFSIVNNSYITQLANTAHTRAYSYQSAGWQQSKAMAQNQAGYANAMDNAATGLANAEANAELIRGMGENTYGAATFGNQAQMLGGAVSSGIDYMFNGGVAGLAGGLIGTAANYMSSQAQTEANYANANLQAATQSNVAQRSAQTARGIADRNQQLGARVAQGDYKNAIAAINASVQDAALTPPSTVGQAGGQGFNWANGLVGVCITYKTIAGGAKSMVADYFRRYGYKVQRFLRLGTVRQMLCMSKFAYWRVLESNLTCARANESERNAMRGVVEKGVTLWDAPESIGSVDPKDNQPRDGYAY